MVTDLTRIPVVGRIFASEPVHIPASDFNYYDAEASVEIATSLLPTPKKGKNFFALEVDGDSMIDAMVNDGDLVILSPIDNNDEIINGEMAAIWLPHQDTTTLKYFYKEKDGYRLQPAHPLMEPILVDKDETVDVRGKVVLVIRSYEESMISALQLNANTQNDEICIEFDHAEGYSKLLTISVLKDEILPYLDAIRTIQSILNKSEKRTTSSHIRITSITRHSPIAAILEGATRAIEFIITRIDPDRKKSSVNFFL